MSGAIVNFEIYTAANTRVYQSALQGINLSGSKSRIFANKWSVPLSQPTGTYRLKVGVYGKHWQPMYAWAAAPNTFTVGGIQTARRSTSLHGPRVARKARRATKLGEGQTARQSRRT
jgi:hypothetical protein